MTLPANLAKVLPPATARAWERIVPVVPDSAYLVGGTALAVHLGHRKSRDLDFFLSAPEDLYALADQLRAIGGFVATTLQDHTLHGVLDEAKVQFILADSQHMLGPLTAVAGIKVAGMDDLLATKLKVLPGRGELRDYFDVMTIEQMTGQQVEDGMDLVITRYEPQVPAEVKESIARALGYFGDVDDDPQLPVNRKVIERYWKRRQPEVIRNLDRRSG